MKPSLILLFLVICNLSMQGQGLYIKPLLGAKVSINKKEITEDFQPNILLKFKSDRVAASPNLLNTFGLNIGYQTKSKKRSYEIGFNYTQTSSGLSVYYLKYVPASASGDTLSYYTPSSQHFKYSAYLLTIPILYRRYFDKNLLKAGKKHQLYFSYMIGITYGIKRNHSSGSGAKQHFDLASPYDTLFINENRIVGYGSVFGDWVSTPLIFNGGISFKVCNQKATELFSFSFVFYYGNANRSGTYVSVTDGAKQRSDWYSGSTGTGLQFELSRNIYFKKKRNT